MEIRRRFADDARRRCGARRKENVFPRNERREKRRNLRENRNSCEKKSKFDFQPRFGKILKQLESERDGKRARVVEQWATQKMTCLRPLNMHKLNLFSSSQFHLPDIRTNTHAQVARKKWQRVRLWCQNSILERCLREALGSVCNDISHKLISISSNAQKNVHFFFRYHSCDDKTVPSILKLNHLQCWHSSSGGPWAANKYKLQSSCLFILPSSSCAAAFRWRMKFICERRLESEQLCMILVDAIHGFQFSKKKKNSFAVSDRRWASR